MENKMKPAKFIPSPTVNATYVKTQIYYPVYIQVAGRMWLQIRGMVRGQLGNQVYAELAEFRKRAFK
jgi:hypothetical protein